jgi:hypothetical protein
MKEKAIELVDSFTYWNTAEAEREGFKSALKCIDEILKVTANVSFYQGVKEEIIKLRDNE